MKLQCGKCLNWFESKMETILITRHGSCFTCTAKENLSVHRTDYPGQTGTQKGTLDPGSRDRGFVPGKSPERRRKEQKAERR
jgi:hypothetical protein